MEEVGLCVSIPLRLLVPLKMLYVWQADDRDVFVKFVREINKTVSAGMNHFGEKKSGVTINDSFWLIKSHS